jgi:hypothetical protein
MPTVVSMDTQWGSGGRGLGKPASIGLCAPGRMSDERGPLVFARFREGCDPPTRPQGGEVSGSRWFAPRSSRSLFVSRGGSSVKGGFRGA